MSGGIARWMGELAKRYPPGSLVVSTGQYAGGREVDRHIPNHVDRLSLDSRRLRTLQGTVLWSRRAVQLTRSLRVAFVWCGNLKPAAYPARWVRRRTDVPYGIMLHGGDLLIVRDQARRSRMKRETARELLQAASVLVTNSGWTADLCRSVLEELQVDGGRSSIYIVPLGADPRVFHPRVDRSEVGTRYRLEGRRWLLSVARLTAHKGVDAGIRALAALQSSYPDLGYLVVGSGDYLSTLEDLSRKLGVSDRVRFLTSVPDRELPAIYASSEVYIGLSRLMDQRVEGFGISLVEASASGIPVLAARTGGIPEAVRHDETGLLVDAERDDQAVAALRRLLDDRDLSARLGAAGRRAVETYYNWDRVAADLMRLGGETRSSGPSQVSRR